MQYRDTILQKKSEKYIQHSEHKCTNRGRQQKGLHDTFKYLPSLSAGLRGAYSPRVGHAKHFISLCAPHVNSTRHTVCTVQYCNVISWSWSFNKRRRRPTFMRTVKKASEKVASYTEKQNCPCQFFTFGPNRGKFASHFSRTILLRPPVFCNVYATAPVFWGGPCSIGAVTRWFEWPALWKAFNKN